MNNPIRLLTMLASAAFTLHTGLQAEVILPSLPVGSQYQLLFVTAGELVPDTSDISVYNNFVRAQAALNPMLPTVDWTAVISTSTTNAISNAPSGSYPVYNTAGLLVASSNIYAGSLLTPVLFDQFGEPPDPMNPDRYRAYAATGSLASGMASPGNEAGALSDRLMFGSIAATDSTWLERSSWLWKTHANDVRLYALSEPITVTAIPEPGPLTLISSVCGVALIVRLLSR